MKSRMLSWSKCLRNLRLHLLRFSHRSLQIIKVALPRWVLTKMEILHLELLLTNKTCNLTWEEWEACPTMQECLSIQTSQQTQASNLVSSSRINSIKRQTSSLPKCQICNNNQCNLSLSPGSNSSNSLPTPKATYKRLMDSNQNKPVSNLKLNYSRRNINLKMYSLWNNLIGHICLDEQCVELVGCRS